MPSSQSTRASRCRPTLQGVDLPLRRFTGKLSLANIYGEWWASARDGFFTVRWGRFFAYLHQFDEPSRAVLIAACAAGEQYRDAPHTVAGSGDHQ